MTANIIYVPPGLPGLPATIEFVAESDLAVIHTVKVDHGGAFQVPTIAALAGAHGPFRVRITWDDGTADLSPLWGAR